MEVSISFKMSEPAGVQTKGSSGRLVELETFIDRLQISLLILSEYNRINELIVPLKSSENLWFSNDFRENRSKFIHLKSLNIREEIWR